jgi:anti-anti-sigma factor
MEITKETTTGRVPVTILRVKGSLDASTSPLFEAGATDAINGGARDLLIDLKGVPYISSAGLRALNTLYQRLHPDASKIEKRIMELGVLDNSYRSPHLKLLNPSLRVREVLNMAGFDMFLDIRFAEPEAILAF